MASIGSAELSRDKARQTMIIADKMTGID